MTEDKFAEILDLVSQDALQRTAELVDYAVIRLEGLLDEEYPNATQQDAEAAVRTIIRSVRAAVDKFELALSEEDFWNAWNDKDRDDDEDDDPPYWGGSNEFN